MFFVDDNEGHDVGQVEEADEKGERSQAKGEDGHEDETFYVVARDGLSQGLGGRDARD
jgi:hypothetical protein